jgi:hypothetical protein
MVHRTVANTGWGALIGGALGSIAWVFDGNPLWVAGGAVAGGAIGGAGTAVGAFQSNLVLKSDDMDMLQY